MNTKRLVGVALAFGLAAAAFAAGGKQTAAPAAPAAPAAAPAAAKVAGSIVVLTHRTDWVDTKFQEYKAAFNKLYPDVNVEFEAIADFNGVVRTRMGTKEYGDVLSMVTVPPVPADFAKFYEPLGSVADFAKTFDFVDTSTVLAYDGVVYGYPINANVSGGFVYNKKVFAAAGIKNIPATTTEFYAALEAIKAKTQAVPLYLNYPSKWPLTQWEGGRLTFAGDADYLNKMVHDDAPFAPGKPHYELYKIMYEVVKRGLVEKDILTADWELSKQMMADGKIGVMALGSWALGQVRALTSAPEDIGYMPYPASVNGKVYAEVGLDYNLAVNKNSKSKEAAIAWAAWFAKESGYAKDVEGIPALKGGAYPAVLSAFSDLGVKYLVGAAAPAGEEGLFDQLDKESEIGLWQDPQKIRIVDAAMGTTKESFDQIMQDWNARWAKARKTLGVK
jgi:ABC-type glycerol-3-phosphate transport system substrate-binding protein